MAGGLDVTRPLAHLENRIRDKRGGLRTAVAIALLLVSFAHQPSCRSDPNSLVFEDEQQLHSYVTTRDLNLRLRTEFLPEEVILQEDFHDERLVG